MKHLLKVLALLVFAVSTSAFAAQPIPATMQVYFSPKGGCTEAIVQELDAAKTSVYVQAYTFTNKYIALALVNAHKRGVTVGIVLDRSQRTEKYSSADFLAHAGIPTFIDAKHVIAHNKIMIIDGQTVITGSFNFTMAAESSNAENLLIIRSPELAAIYMKNWLEHQSHSAPYAGR